MKVYFRAGAGWAALVWGAACASTLFPSCYEAGVASAYLGIISKARPVNEVLADPAAPEAVKAFLGRAADVRAFAISELGLKESKNYTTYVDPGRDHIADVVQGCARLSFTRYLWSYPIVGKLPYKGFFTKEEAKAEAARLKAAGWDALVRPVDSFSTLGFLPDPLWSYMESYSEGELADLIIHELTHATAFKKGHDDFNEELASFAGERGSILYLKKRFGPGSGAEKAALAEQSASKAFRAFLAATAAKLEIVYSGGGSDDEKLAEKAAIIAERAGLWKAEAARLGLPPNYANFEMASVDNAYLDLYRLYYGEEDLYPRVCDQAFGGDLKAFIREAARLARTEKDPKAALRLLIGPAAAAAKP